MLVAGRRFAALAHCAIPETEAATTRLMIEVIGVLLAAPSSILSSFVEALTWDLPRPSVPAGVAAQREPDRGRDEVPSAEREPESERDASRPSVRVAAEPRPKASEAGSGGIGLLGVSESRSKETPAREATEERAADAGVARRATAGGAELIRASSIESLADIPLPPLAREAKVPASQAAKEGEALASQAEQAAVPEDTAELAAGKYFVSVAA